jgi:hypothetical protein
VGLWINDLLKKQYFRFWSYLIGLSFLIGSIYFIWQFLAFGDALFRFKTIVEEGHYISGDSYFDKNWQALLKRITYQPVIMLLHSSMIIPFGLAFPALMGYRARKFWQHTAFEKFWSYAALSILLYFWWGSTSWQYYNPIALFQRHLLLIVPPLAILSGISLIKVREHPGLYAIVFGLIALAGIWVNAGPVLLIYVLIFGVFILCSILQNVGNGGEGRYGWIRVTIILSLVFILIIHPIYSMLKPSESGYSNLSEMVEMMKSEGKDILIVTDRQVADNCEYVFRFWKQKPVCMPFSEFHTPAYLLEYDKVYMLKYDFHLPSYRKQYQTLMKLLEDNTVYIKPVHSLGNVHLFKVFSSTDQITED